jgi:hypothetical protein
MLELKYSEFINEEMSTISVNKLRDAMHDIIVGLNPKQTIDVDELSSTLENEYKITISPLFLDKFLDEYIKAMKGNKKVKTFFIRSDAKWLGVRDVNGVKKIRNNLHFLAPSLAKHKQKLWSADEKKRIDNAYKAGMMDLNFNEDLINQSLVLQTPKDSEEMMKLIYKEVIVNKKYENSFDNCWKMMMLLAKNMKLDRKRYWFKLAPSSIRTEFTTNGKIDYTLKKYDKEKSKIIPVDVTTKAASNLHKIDSKLAMYENWDAIVKKVTLRQIIEIIDSLTPEVKFESDLDKFLAQINILTSLLSKYYMVEKKQISNFYFQIELDDYVKDWNDSNQRPRVTDF